MDNGKLCYTISRYFDNRIGDNTKKEGNVTMIYLNNEARASAINSIDELMITVSRSNMDYISAGEVSKNFKGSYSERIYER